MKTLVFQFSSFEDSKYIEKLMEAIRRLGGKYDESKLYSPKATHLIIEKMECTEKILCFIAAGKWIITHSYLKHSLKAGQFLPEKDFHVSFHRPDSKLASVSLKWQNYIQEKKKNAPFQDWNVGCYLQEEEKSKALIRIIKAGHGTASLASSRRSSTKFTLIIFDDENREKAKSIATQFKVPYYPYQSIPDYIMLCVKGDGPMLPLSHYESQRNHDQLNNTHENTESSISIATDAIPSDEQNELLHIEFSALSSFKSLFTSLNLSKTKNSSISQEVESQFFVFWENNATNEALNLIVSLSTDELPSSQMFLILFEFMMVGTSNGNSNFASNANEINDAIYDSVYSYILNFILNHPPIDKSMMNFYEKVFKDLKLEAKIMSSKSLNEIKGLVDTLYLLSVHDYIVLNSNGRKSTTLNSHALLQKLDQDSIFKKLIDIITKNNNKVMPVYICYKVLDVLSFCDSFLNESNISCKLDRYIKNSDKRSEGKFNENEYTNDLDELYCSLRRK